MEDYEMAFNQFKRNICRICLDENVYLDWNTSLYQFRNTTYKDCYYKYTQLESSASDPFPQMLCQNCSNALHNTHLLISKALRSHKLLKNELSSDGHMLKELKISKYSDTSFTPVEFETVLVEMIEEPTIEDHLKSEESSEEVVVTSNVSTRRDQQPKDSKITNSLKAKIKVEQPLKEPSNISLEINASPTKSKRKCTPRVERKKTIKNNKSDTIVEKQNIEKVKPTVSKVIEFDDDDDDDDETNEEVETAKVRPKVRSKNKVVEKPTMCSICSKILHSKYSAQRHEKTHIENRERKETCKICGLKLYDKRGLYSHMLIHKENREKRHKCEFCSKAFYNKGGLNIHRRIHLGQMVPCSLCSKEFFRQVDLDIHMNSHSATTINSDTKKRSRYYVRCEYCDKSILSTSFKSHTAAHLNEPLMKCLICNKEYFTRGSCVIHVKKVHNKSNDEYNDFISIYNNNRISHLFLEQQADLLPSID